MLLHIGGASTASIITTIVVIFFLIFAISFAFGKIPEGQSRYSGEWVGAWFRASLPRLIISGVFSGLLLAGALIGGNGKTTPATAASCDRTIPPLTGQALTDSRILVAIDGTQQIADAARDNDKARVQALFYSGDSHNVMHDIDFPLRAKDESLAKNLCLAVVVVENQMASSIDTEVIARESNQIIAFLQQARAILNLPATSTPGPVIGSGYCLQPLGAITSQPLSEQRLTDAATALRATATAIIEGRNDDASTHFYNDAHDVTHDIDGPLRAADEQLAIGLCEKIVDIETQLATTGVTDPDALAASANGAADDIEAAGRTLEIIQ